MTARTARPSRSTGQTGMTLIELVVVVLVLGILAGLAGVPASADGSDAALDLVEVQLDDAFRVAQTLAYSLGTPHGVVFDPSGDRFAVVALGGETAVDPLTHGDYIVDFSHPEQPRDLDIVRAEFSSTGAAGIFDASGVPLQGGTITIARSGQARTFVFDAATGRISAN